MKNLWSALMAVIMTLALILLGCGPTTSEPAQVLPPEPVGAPILGATPELAYLQLNPVETSMPIYGGILTASCSTPTSFDGHMKASYGPMNQLPAFNQLVMFDLAYKGIAPETIIGDLADSWETSPDGTEITLHLHQGVKWHDGMPFTADDVVYSLDKMTDPNRSAISDLFPAYQSTERINDYTVKVHLKYASAGFMMSLAGGYSQIQAKHKAGTDDQSIDFVMGTGPFIMTEYLVRVHTKWKRNPDYFKKDKYGNQLPYLDGLYFFQGGAEGDDVFIAHRLDVRHLVVSGSNVESYQKLLTGAPDALWQRKFNTDSVAFFLNLKHKPLDDIRVRRAMALVLEEQNTIVGYSGDVAFGITNTGLLYPSMGLPKEEIRKLMGWDKPMEERVAEAKQLMAEAGYPDGFKLNMLSWKASGAQTVGFVGANLVFADALKRILNIDCEVHPLAGTETTARLADDNYDLYCQTIKINDDAAQLVTFFGTSGFNNWSHYSNIDIDNMLSEVDRIIDPEKRQDLIWEIERLLLTDLPALPSGVFPTRHMFYYPHVKNLRFQTQIYSNICRCEDVWIDPSLKPAGMATGY